MKTGFLVKAWIQRHSSGRAADACDGDGGLRTQREAYRWIAVLLTSVGAGVGGATGMGLRTCGRHQYGAALRSWCYESLRVSAVRASRLRIRDRMN
eukprot:5025887-Pleurochrysis_carterae.AAC.1